MNGTLLGLRANRRRPARDGERGQILILFTLVIVVLLAATALVIDVGLLRTDAARLQNALDAGALAGAHSMPADSSNVSDVRNTALQYVDDNYPYLPTPDASFACLVGVDDDGLPRVTDMPSVCNVSLPANSSLWRCTATVCWAPCDPTANATDVCNTLALAGDATQPYSFGRVVGINEGNTGTKVSAACKGPCGQPPAVPVDAIVILDRTSSMNSSRSVANLRSGADYVLGAFNPELQRVALGFTGPTSLYRYASDTSGLDSTSQPDMSCTSPNTVNAIALSPGASSAGPVPSYGNASSTANASGGATSLVLDRPSGVASGNLMLAAVSVSSNVSINAPSGWNQVRVVDSGWSTDRVRLAVYSRVAGSSEPSTYTFSWSGAQRASGGIVSYSGVGSSPIAASSSNSGSGTSAQASSVSAVENSALVAFYGVRSASTWSPPSGMNERVDVVNGDASGPATEIVTDKQSAAGSTGSRTATASASGRWAAVLVAVAPTSGPTDTYGTDVVADNAQWIPVGFTGLDTSSPAVAYQESYSDEDGNVATNTHVHQAIHCFDVSRTGTNLARPLYMAIQYLADHGRPGVKQGIILETDGAPNSGGYGPSSDYTNSGVLAAATAAKNAGIELFTIGYGVDSSTVNLLGQMATGPAVGGSSCTAAENTDGDHFFCQPTGGDLADVLKAAAIELAGGTKLIQLYPQPVVTGVSPNSGGNPGGGTHVAITGKYFTEAYSVTFGGTPALSFTVVSDTQINAVAPAGTPGATVDIQVSTPGGSSKIVAADRFTYGP